MNLTKNFTLEELTKSITAIKLKIDNKPNEIEIDYLRQLAELLQVIRNEYGKPIVIDSGFRCEKLNKIVGGTKNSDHRFGCAADIHSLSDTFEDNKVLWDCIIKLADTKQINCRQIIDEYNLNWIHISINNKFNKIKNNEIVYVK